MVGSEGILHGLTDVSRVITDVNKIAINNWFNVML